MPTRMEALLEVNDLSVQYSLPGGRQVPAVFKASFSLQPGEAVGLLGESGCGKTTTALAVTGLLPGNARLAAGSVRFRGHDLLSLSPAGFEKIRGAEISLIFQEPTLALNPVMRIGRQVAEVIRAHRPWGADRCRAEAVRMLERVRLPDPPAIFSAYPHQLSGGQRRRVLIAQALSCGPALVIADEPTNGLDSRTQAEILSLLVDLKNQFHTSFLFISHHPGILASLADRLLIMYAGCIVEEGDLGGVCRDPLHPYTRGLLDSMPRAPSGTSRAARQRLRPIEGSPPDMTDLPEGCSFAPRCPERMEICSRHGPRLLQTHPLRWVRCAKYETE